ncbi:MAG: T9SS type A sorting domain-containing protein [Bacteroidales bacterium]
MSFPWWKCKSLKYYAGILVLLHCTAFTQTPGYKKVLFLGNSYTYANDLPGLLREVAASAGDTVEVDSNTPGGYTFQLHSNNIASLDKIMQGDWDFVVLQEQSQIPSFPISQVESMCFPYAHILDSIINQYNSCGETMFFMTWGRKNGDASNCASWPPVCTYHGMDSLLRLRYQILADSNDAVLSPVGAVWHYLRDNFPNIELYSADESHPSPSGTYAAACAFYSSIFRKDPLDIVYNYTLSPVDAANIRYAASKVVFDSLMYWNIGLYDPKADFSFTLFPDFLVEFENTSHYAQDYYWDFGDGSSSQMESPSHQYPGPGNYSVMLVSSACELDDTLVTNINITQVGTREISRSENLWEVYPNPTNKLLFIKGLKQTSSDDKVQILSISGKVIMETSITGENFQVDISEIKPGYYRVIVRSATLMPESRAFIKL